MKCALVSPLKEMFIIMIPEKPRMTPTILFALSLSLLSTMQTRIIEMKPPEPERIVPVTPLVWASPM